MTDLFMFVLSLDYHILDYDKNFYLFTFVEESPTKKSELNEVLNRASIVLYFCPLNLNVDYAELLYQVSFAPQFI